jgi:hypothetical protein
MNFHSLAFRYERPHLFPVVPTPSIGRRALPALLPLAVGIAMALSTVASKIPGLPMDKAALALCLTLAIMGIISPSSDWTAHGAF